MNRKTWIIFIVICVALVGGLVWMSQQNKTDVSSVNVSELQPASEASGNIAERVYGNRDAKVVLMEYGDYQCPGCGSAAPVLKEISEKYKDNLAFVFRNFPLTSIHPNARAAAAAAEAAGEQNKFWEMHDLLYTNQDAWSELGGSERNDQFTTYAESLGLNIDQWNEAVSSPDVSAKINFDAALGKKAGVSGTPAIYLNGEKIDQQVLDGKLVDANTEGAQPIWTDLEAFETLILIPALKEAGVTIEE